jgi:tripartite-type tricarboxylate transporter receptor subunit TctC
MSGWTSRCAISVAALALCWSPAHAADGAAGNFYAGRTVTLLCGSGPGGGYDRDARIVEEHIARHIPGKPMIVMQYMPGASGMKAANYMYAIAPKDGSIFALLTPTAAYLQKTSNGARYDASKFQYIGRLASLNNVLVVWHTASAKTLADMKKTEVVLAAVGKGDQGFVGPAMMRELLGYKFKLITGYPDAKQAVLALERGEVQGRTSGWPAWQAEYPEWVAQKKIIPIVEIGLQSSKEFAGKIPLALDLVKDARQRKLLEFTSASAAIGRVFSLPPQVPADRVQALRRAFDATMADPVFLADARKRKTAVEPMTGEEVQKIVENAVAAPPDIVAEVKRLLAK